MWSSRERIVEWGEGFSDTDEPSLESRVAVNVIDYGMDRRDDLRIQQILSIELEERAHRSQLAAKRV